MRRFTLLALLALAGCAHVGTKAVADAQPEPEPVNAELRLVGQGDWVEADFNADRIIGESVTLTRGTSALRGSMFSAPVDIALSSEAATGTVGAGPVKLSVTPIKNGFRARGLFGGSLSDFSFSPKKIQGTIASCSYDLKWADDGYVGARACGNGIEQVSLELPATLAQRSAPEVAATLALFLGRG